MESIAQQTYAFLMTILAGGVVGFIFDVYRVVRALFSPRQLATAMTDLLYWIVVTPTLFALLLAGNWGELRFYVLLGLGIGLLLYFQALSAAVVWALATALRSAGRAVGYAFAGAARALLFPFVLLHRLVTGLVPAWGRPRRVRWGQIPVRPRPPRLALAWQKLSLLRFFGRIGG